MILATTTAAKQIQIQIRVEPGGAAIMSTPGVLLLEALLRAGAPISYSCRAGRCGTCRCELLAGEILEDADCEFRSTRVPGAARQVLACRSRLVGNCVIGLVEPDEIVVHRAQTLKCQVESVHQLNSATIALRLRPNRPLHFSAGQFAKLDFGSDLVRPYSMANPENAETLEFHLRHVPGGRVTSFVAAEVRPGRTVKVTGPLGTSYLRRKHTGPMLCVAGGTGLAPIGSIVRTALESTTQGPISLYVGARSETELYAIEALHALERKHPSRLRLVLATDARPHNGSVQQGLITDVLGRDLTSLSGWKVYLAGPPPMVEAGVQMAARLGARPGDIHADAFYPSEN